MNTELRNEWKDIRIGLGNLICHLDGKMESLEAEEKRISERRDESYWQGVQDFYEATKVLTVGALQGGMSIPEMDEYFDTPYILDILNNNDPKTIMETVDKWKADKKQAEEEIQIGDEVIVEMSPVFVPNELLKGIVINMFDNGLLAVAAYHDDNVVWVRKKNTRKTGRHFDGIPFSYFDKGEHNA